MRQYVFQFHTSSVGEFRYSTFCISVFVIVFSLSTSAIYLAI